MLETTRANGNRKFFRTGMMTKRYATDKIKRSRPTDNPSNELRKRLPSGKQSM